MKELIEKFYQSFEKLDAESMAECYHDQACFIDPAFSMLEGSQVKNMWRMLCSNPKSKNLHIVYSDIQEEDSEVTAHWEAHYTFGKSNRPVHNVINSHFKFRDGKIIYHIDDFDLYKWSKQALGFSGYLFGWTTYFRSSLNVKTKKILADFAKKNKLRH